MCIFSFNKVAFAQVFSEKLGIIFKLEDNMIGVPNFFKK